jgi:hypothetical protein
MIVSMTLILPSEPSATSEFTVRHYFVGKGEDCLYKEKNGYSPLWTSARSFNVEREVHVDRYGSCSIIGHWADNREAREIMTAARHDCAIIEASEAPVLLQSGPGHICGVGPSDPGLRIQDRSLREGGTKYEDMLEKLENRPLFSAPLTRDACEKLTATRSGWLHRSYRIVDRQGSERIEQCMIAILDSPEDEFKNAKPAYLSADVSVCRRFELLDRQRDHGRAVRLAILRRATGDHACSVERTGINDK